MRRIYSNPSITIPLAIIGFNDVGRYLYDQVASEMTFYEPVGFIDESPEGRQYRGLPVLQGLGSLTEMAKLHPCLEVAIALPDARARKHEDIIEMCEENRVRWWLVPWVFNAPPAGLKVDMMGVVPLLTLRGSNIEGLNFIVKRGFDLSRRLDHVGAGGAHAGCSRCWRSGSKMAVRSSSARPASESAAQEFDFLKLRSMRSAAGDNAHREYVKKWIRHGDKAAR